MEHWCHDRRFAMCSCKGCTRMCSCLMRDKMAMPCPIPNCRERAEEPDPEKQAGSGAPQEIQMRFL